jgi:molybdopterin synthase sulfur carrier subunit
MSPDPSRTVPGETTVTVRYWASARAAAGVPQDLIPLPGPISLAALIDLAVGRHDESDGLRKVLHVCSVLVDDRPVRSSDPADVLVEPGASVEFLPPFAGG